MISVAVINRKGGVGKTTMAAHIAGGLALRGYKVALIDTDPQGNAATILGMPKENGVWNMMVEKMPITEVVRPVPFESYVPVGHDLTGMFWLLPSDTDTYMIPLKVQSALSLRTRIREMARLLELDVVIIDTAPTASMFDGAIYFAADAVVYVTECETLSIDGLNEGLMQLNEHNVERVEMNMNPLPVLGIQPNKFRGTTSDHRKWIAELGNAYQGFVWEAIPLRVLWTDATSYGQLLFNFANNRGEAHSAWAMVDRFEGAINACLRTA